MSSSMPPLPGLGFMEIAGRAEVEPDDMTTTTTGGTRSWHSKQQRSTLEKKMDSMLDAEIKA